MATESNLVRQETELTTKNTEDTESQFGSAGASPSRNLKPAREAHDQIAAQMGFSLFSVRVELDVCCPDSP